MYDENISIDTRGNWTGTGSLSQLATTLRARKAARIDCVVDPRQLCVNVSRDGELLLASVSGTQAAEFIPTEGIVVRDRAVTQLCSRMNPDVPASFGKRLIAERPSIAVDMFNSLIDRDDYSKNRRLLVRMLHNNVRAVLSDRYLVIDDEDLMYTALEELQHHGGRVMSCQLTDDHMRMSYCCPALGQALDSPARGDGSFFNAGSLANPEWRARIGLTEEDAQPMTDRGGNAILPGGEIGNSETGAGAAHVRFKTFDSICFNGCVSETVHQIRHLGEKLEAGIWSPATVTKNAELKQTMVKDAVKATFCPDRLAAWMQQRIDARMDILAPTAAVDNVATLCELSEDDRDQLLAVFCRDYSPNRDGLSQAAARFAQDQSNPDKASEWESHAATIIECPKAVNHGALVTVVA